MRRITTALIGLTLPLLSHSADIDAGKDKAQVCTACHGGNGVSISDEIPNLAELSDRALPCEARRERIMQ
jgi:cytochrome c553